MKISQDDMSIHVNATRNKLIMSKTRYGGSFWSTCISYTILNVGTCAISNKCFWTEMYVSKTERENQE